MFALQKSMESIVKTEWEAVKNVPSLFKHYGRNQKEYQKWRERFVRAGYLAKNQRKQRRSKADTRAYNRAYYAKWRPLHKDRVLQYSYDHWKKKIGCVQNTIDLKNIS
jgi:hypothetical protein